MLYREKFRDSEKAEKYYRMAIAQDHISSMHNLGYLYDENGDYEKAEIYYKMAADRGFCK